MNIYRHYEDYDPENSLGFLHDINYIVENSKVKVLNLRTKLVKDSIVQMDTLVSDKDPINQMTAMAAYSILLHDELIDKDGKYNEH